MEGALAEVDCSNGAPRFEAGEIRFQPPLRRLAAAVAVDRRGAFGLQFVEVAPFHIREHFVFEVRPVLDRLGGVVQSAELLDGHVAVIDLEGFSLNVGRYRQLVPFGLFRFDEVFQVGALVQGLVGLPRKLEAFAQLVDLIEVFPSCLSDTGALVGVVVETLPLDDLGFFFLQIGSRFVFRELNQFVLLVRERFRKLAFVHRFHGGHRLAFGGSEVQARADFTNLHSGKVPLGNVPR